MRSGAPRVSARRPLVGLVACGVLSACDNARPQLLVDVTSDLAVPSQIASDPAIAAAGSFDRVRVETLGPDGAPTTTRDFVIDGESTFPLSFGVAAPDDPSRELVVRVTAFRARFASVRGAEVSPLRYARVERLLTVAPHGVEEVKIALRGACLGTPADPAKRTTCIDAEHLAGAPAPSTEAALPGSFASLRATPCARTPAADRVCIPGGLGLVGSPRLALGEADRVGAEPRLVTLSPFVLTKAELTVGALRKLFAAGLAAERPKSKAERATCNYTDGAASQDAEAARCVPFSTARAACQALGGDLPTAAQWEYAARGRGAGRGSQPAARRRSRALRSAARRPWRPDRSRTPRRVVGSRTSPATERSTWRGASASGCSTTRGPSPSVPPRASPKTPPTTH